MNGRLVEGNFYSARNFCSVAPLYLKKKNPKLTPPPISSTPLAPPPSPLRLPAPFPLPHPSDHVSSPAPSPSPSPALPLRSPIFSPLHLLPLFQHPPHSPTPAPPSQRLLPTPWHRPSPAPAPPKHRPSPAPLRLSSTVRPNRLNGRPSFDQTGSNKGPLFGSVWPNGVGRGASARERSARLMPKSEKETRLEGKEVVLGREGDEGGTGERGEGGGQETRAEVWREKKGG